MSVARKHSAEVMVAEGSNDWYTPESILRPTRAIAATPTAPGRIALDPFWGPGCITAPVVGIDEARDGFAVDWARAVERAVGQPGAAGFVDVFTNPPYSRMPDFAKKVSREAARGVEIVALVKSSTAENWFSDLVWRSATSVCFVYGRVRHAPGPGADPASEGNTAPFSSAVTYHGPRPDRFAACFRSTGQIFRLR